MQYEPFSVRGEIYVVIGWDSVETDTLDVLQSGFVSHSHDCGCHPGAAVSCPLKGDIYLKSKIFELERSCRVTLSVMFFLGASKQVCQFLLRPDGFYLQAGVDNSQLRTPLVSEKNSWSSLPCLMRVDRAARANRYLHSVA